MVHQDLRKGLSKQESFELSFKRRQRGEIAQTDEQRELQTDGAMKLKERPSTGFKLPLGIFQSFSLEDRRVRDVWYARSEADR